MSHVSDTGSPTGTSRCPASSLSPGSGSSWLAAVPLPPCHRVPGPRTYLVAIGKKEGEEGVPVHQTEREKRGRQ